MPAVTERSPWLAPVGVALGSVTLAAALSLLLRDWISATPFALFYLAIMLATAISGRRAGWVAVALSIVAVKFLVLEPVGSLSIDRRALGSLAVSGVVAGVTVWLVGRIRHSAQIARARRLEIEHADAEVQRARQLVDTMFESVPGVIYLYDADGRFLRWNHNLLAVTGYSAGEIAELRPPDFFRGEDVERVRERIADVFATGSGAIGARLVAKDGTATPYWFTGRRIMLDGRPCLVGMGIDVSDRVRAEERYRSTLEGILEGCQVIGPDWRYLYLNPAAAVHNRRSNDELLGRTMQDCWPGIEASPVFALLERCMRERVAVRHETEFTFATGDSAWFDIHAQPVPEGIFVLSIDVTNRHRAEAAEREIQRTLIEATAELERQVETRTLELRAALLGAEAADRLKSAFLATMSHELRTPLNSIIGFTGIVLQELAGPLTPEQSKQLGMVRSSARHLLDLINDVLDLSKIEAGQMEVRPEPVDLRAAVERTTGLVRPLAEKQGLTLTVVIPGVVSPLHTDRRRLDQILLNLLSNAVKFTERGSITVRVDGDAMAQGRKVAQIAITDTGIGIRPDDLATLFQPFRQVDTGLARQREGTGLGLAICRRLADLLGGTIRAESRFGVGSTFVVTLPLEREG